ncbi:HAD-IA family hydrolase [Bradyrhizobium sp. AUGA SZCCT0169]|uniref:HAD-IA family hydrolase n=1 Tax=Bradyrhizobium sp. AUGA SZCCT0169 TaxID=2807663 RepID=UPI001BA532E8|nr:HAD-IA family hydrolase [Bradyrhizobium sp. AUGA SZCCT0169]MBR1246596.1 HAD-IA family hydrolase [Bradyrhizobium sp. AUGA SZCCT0169]
MPRYRLAIFDFDGTLADSLPWFRTVFQDLIAKFDLAPVSAEELEGLRGRSGREIIARLNMPMWKLPAISRDMRRRKLAAANQISLFDGVPQLLADLRNIGIHAAIVSSDSEASVRQVLGPSAALIARFDCGASLFGKHHKFKRVARQLGTSPSEVLCIGDELRDIEAARAAGMDSGAVAWGYALPAALQAARPTHFFHTFEEIKQEFAIA